MHSYYFPGISKEVKNMPRDEEWEWEEDEDEEEWEEEDEEEW